MTKLSDKKENNMLNSVKNKKIALHNLGCKVNGYEMDVMEQRLKEAGAEIVPFSDKADIYIINTCTVTNIADRKSRQMLHKSKKENPEAIVVAVGCYVETGFDGVKKDDSIDLAVGNNKKGEIVDILNEFLSARSDASDKTLCGASVIDINATKEYENMFLTELPEHTRAYIKIQDGCNQFCSYCVIPYARGRVRSRDPQEVLREVKGLVQKGCKEVVLTGIHISSYGTDFADDTTDLIGLTEMINEIAGISRIRLGSLEPRIITEENVKRLVMIDKLCPHFHLSLQSGCESVLKRMNRHYTPEEFAKGVELLRQHFDRPAITTDVIVGFPGETAEEFEECRKFVEDINFYEMHVFKYSPRKGTVAAGMPGQLTDRQKSERSDVLLDLTRGQSESYRSSFIGEKLDILWEDKEEIKGREYMTGHSDRYVKVAVPTDSPLCIPAVTGNITTVVPTALLDGDTLLI